MSSNPHRAHEGPAAYSTGEAVRITGVKFSLLNFWDKSGMLKPSIAQANGKGSDRLYSLADLYALRALATIPIENSGIRQRMVAAIRANTNRVELSVVVSEVAHLAIYLPVIKDQVHEEIAKIERASSVHSGGDASRRRGSGAGIGG